ncbi:MAG: TIR domain-containing protein [Elainellaceae cyanobacterium]
MDFTDVFISYGRADSKAFAAKLEQYLLAAGLRVWVDFNDIPSGVDYQKQIDAGIDRADNFIFVISPHSVNSVYCLKEIEHALKRNKRIVPLLHVEAITRETWNQRHPEGTAAEWEAYQAAGKHSSHGNLHPDISKINWVCFRDGLDDFEQACQNLLHALDRHKDYIRQHTVLLVHALTWAKNQRQTRYLLVAEAREQAEAWLLQRFKEQAPCTPTDLHCEFIAESIKNANNLLTQVFVAHAEQDVEVMETIRRSLWRQGFTVWTRQTDIQTGEDFQSAVDRGIEQADNVVCLLSPAALQSANCQRELNYALAFHKRVIPVLVEATDATVIPSVLRDLQYIDLTDNVLEADYLLDESQLLRVLQQDATYYQEHKILLTKALRWTRQDRNPSMLLRGYNLRHAEAWLKTAESRTQHRPTAIQAEFVRASLNHTQPDSLDVFISYSRADADLARRLNEALQIQNKTTWFDQESIASGADFQQEINRGIEISDHFLFILSPRAVRSPYCIEEVSYAAKLNKRIVTVLHHSVDSDELPPQLAKIQWIDFRSSSSFTASFKELIRTLDTDVAHLRMHTRLLTRAIEWKQENFDRSLLLRGKPLARAHQWLTQAEDKYPPPTELHVDFIITSLGPSYYLRAQGPKIKFRWVVLIGVIVALLVEVTRLLGWTQGLELAAYDQLLRMRLSEPQDDRLLIVQVDQNSVRWLKESMIAGKYQPGIGTIPDRALADAIEYLNDNGARLIGLHVHRDFPAGPNLTRQFQQLDNLIAICWHGGNSDSGITPPDEVPIARVGFDDLLSDESGEIRRYLLKRAANRDFCETQDSFSLALARRYLAQAGLSYTDPQEENPDLKLGQVTVPQLYRGNSGGYRRQVEGPDGTGGTFGGYQVLINFRQHEGDPNRFAPIVTLEAVLEGEVSPRQIADRIIVIGLSNQNASYFDTPYGRMPAIVLQGQMISQLISAALEGRSLIWSWSPGGEWLWILGWSLMGGQALWGCRRLRAGCAVAVGSALLLFGVCYFVLVQFGGWIPLVPPALAMLGTGLWVGHLTSRLRLRKLAETNQRLLRINHKSDRNSIQDNLTRRKDFA